MSVIRFFSFLLLACIENSPSQSVKHSCASQSVFSVAMRSLARGQKKHIPGHRKHTKPTRITIRHVSQFTGLSLFFFLPHKPWAIGERHGGSVTPKTLRPSPRLKIASSISSPMVGFIPCSSAMMMVEVMLA